MKFDERVIIKEGWGYTIYPNAVFTRSDGTVAGLIEGRTATMIWVRLLNPLTSTPDGRQAEVDQRGVEYINKGD